MRRVRLFWRSVYDVRPGEGLRTLFMALHMLCVVFAYTRVAVRTSLAAAVNWSTAVTVVCLLGIWWMLRFNFDWMLYVFNIWVSLFSIVTVSQAWLVAANVFNSREAKRLYGLLG